MISKTIALDLWHTPAPIDIVQYETGRQLIFELPFEPDTATLYADGYSWSGVVDGAEVTVTPSVDVAGLLECTLVLVTGTNETRGTINLNVIGSVST